ncbi:family 1 glycosylhydrolase, partial [Staphylococcus epidermidis]|uniref:family 1 glycosylhydrolase n=1 Tax=Staphylococcus epidermidis TaxID=1282 RepID=UPI00119E4721
EFERGEVVQKDGELLNGKRIEYFVDYGEFCFKEFGEVKYWRRLNEIGGIGDGEYLVGKLGGGMKYEFEKVLECDDNMMVGEGGGV